MVEDNAVPDERARPLHAHRFLPAGRDAPGHPVLSVRGTDIIRAGATAPARDAPPGRRRLPHRVLSRGGHIVRRKTILDALGLVTAGTPLGHTARRNQCHTRNRSPPRRSSPTRRSGSASRVSS
ncbi:hypothetical protein C5L38_01170 [Streptomyces sp. WAC00288]|uniref:Uncharacterized protein n=1 Tax=Streptomyces cinereoruber TaxID=67260 RepID=A0ABX6BPS7_9ACTN|nr:hypothetical protein C5L38_01170 [Streptomyces sp. WAC00288]PVC76519.1 hypothetical protein DBP18_07390 [Streptomyces sp. CS081A]QEV36417.1 hypothetical protein CP977_33090 [Streptomyces cinereoruber]